VPIALTPAGPAWSETLTQIAGASDALKEWGSKGGKVAGVAIEGLARLFMLNPTLSEEEHAKVIQKLYTLF
jgi:hypothetical protein